MSNAILFGTNHLQINKEIIYKSKVPNSLVKHGAYVNST